MRIWETEKGKPYKPVPGKIYKNEGGGEYLCIRIGGEPSQEKAWFQNIRSGWRCLCSDVRKYSDGTIDWAYSKLGEFAPLPEL